MSFFEFPHTRTYDTDLGWLIKKMKEIIDTVQQQNDKIAAVEQLAQELKNFVNNYFDNLDVQQEINNKIDQMARDGSLAAVLEEPAADAVAAWLAEHITPTTPPVDDTLTVSGAAADAKVTGDEIRGLRAYIDGFISDSAALENTSLSKVSGAGASVTSMTAVLETYSLSDYGIVAGEVLHVIASSYTTDYPNTINSPQFGVYFYDANNNVVGGRTRWDIPTDAEIIVPALADHFSAIFYCVAPSGGTRGYTFTVNGITISKKFKYTLSSDVEIGRPSIEKAVNNILNNTIIDNEILSKVSGAGTSTTNITTIFNTYKLSDYDTSSGDILHVVSSGYSTDYTDAIANPQLGMYFYDENNTLIGVRNKWDFPVSADVIVPEGADHFIICLVLTAPNGNVGGHTFTVNGVTVTQNANGETTEYPSYYNEHLIQKIATIRQRNLTCSRNGDGFIFVTDPHWATNAKHSTGLAEKIAAETDNKLFICGGDILNQSHTRAEALSIMWSYMNGVRRSFGKRYRYLVGNHELNTMANVPDADHLTWDDVYAVCMKDIENDVDIYGSNDIETFIYHWDNERQKIRYIVLNSGTSMQYTGNYSALDNLIRTAPAGYKIGVFGHGFFNTSGELLASAEYVAGMLNAANTRSTYTFYGTTYDYSDVNVEIMFAMCGHAHQDLYYRTDGGVPIIGVTTDNYGQELGGLSRTSGTISEQAFDVVNIDTDSRTIYLTRIGAGNDRTYTWSHS